MATREVVINVTQDHIDRGQQQPAEDNPGYIRTDECIVALAASEALGYPVRVRSTSLSRAGLTYYYYTIAQLPEIAGKFINEADRQWWGREPQQPLQPFSFTITVTEPDPEPEQETLPGKETQS